MRPKNYLKQTFKIGLISCALMSVSSNVLASGITVPFGNGVSSLALNRAGDAAAAYDATSNVTNPAGLIRVKHDQAIVSAVGVLEHRRFSGIMSNPGLSHLFFLLPSLKWVRARKVPAV